MAFDEDLSVFFSDAEFGVEATIGGVTGLVIYDENGAILEEFGIQHSGPSVICPVTLWPAIAIGNTMTIPAISGTYTVRSALRVDDGALMLIALTR